MSANSGNVLGGHKANLSKVLSCVLLKLVNTIADNPNTSEESKQHSREVLENAENGGEVESASKSSGDANPNNVAGGLKATLNNPNVSDEAKQSAKERLENM